MQTFIYEGSVHPDAIPLTLGYRPGIVRRQAAESPDAEFEVTVFAGRFQTKVSVPLVNDEIIEDLFVPAWSVIEGLVHSAGFLAGIPYTATIERVLLADGQVKQFQLADRSLARAHGLASDKLEALVDLAMVDQRVRLLLSDALKMLGVSDYAPIACGRVADGVARLIAPSEGDRARWRQTREILRVDEPFLRSLTEVSKAARHADRIEVAGHVNQATAHRAWILLGRYLHFRMYGPLDPETFPLLSTTDRPWEAD